MCSHDVDGDVLYELIGCMGVVWTWSSQSITPQSKVAVTEESRCFDDTRQNPRANPLTPKHKGQVAKNAVAIGTACIQQHPTWFSFSHKNHRST